MPDIHEMADLLPDLCELARDAGAIEKQVFENGFTAEIKQDGSPVTIADQKAEALIIEKLAKLTPDIPFIGEESVADGHMPDVSTGLYWLVDPLDGTKEFVGGGNEFTVNIALMDNFEPVMGVIYVPMTDELYAAAGSRRVFMQKTGSLDEIPLSVRKLPENGITVVTSRRHGDPKKIENFLQGYKVNDVLACSSSLKFCAIARGDADLYPRLGPTSEWDTGAGDAILHAAGGHIMNFTGSTLKYGKAEEKFLNPNFIACSDSLYNVVHDAVQNM